MTKKSEDGSWFNCETDLDHCLDTKTGFSHLHIILCLGRGQWSPNALINCCTDIFGKIIHKEF